MRALATLAALSGAMAVIAGAYGAHGATGKPAEWLVTGSHYQLVHAVAVLAAIARPGDGAGAAAGLAGGRVAGWLFVAGAGVFAGTLYAMALGAPAWFGAITPIGGLLLIAGWLVLAVAAWRRPMGPVSRG